jgi:8-oxo-dGTP pyrophosphatase MutT (NUDIX family)
MLDRKPLMREVWKPNVTVAAVVQRDGKFLLVEEETTEGIRFNQPAGHLEENESLVDAVVRETLEETGHTFKPTFLLGIYQWPHRSKEITYLRFAFGGELLGHDPERTLDDGIIAARWLSLDEMRATQDVHRSPLILRCAEDLVAGIQLPLSAITHYAKEI